ncbi:MAG: hypothetical protein PHS41_03875 [Victivallaceae bacterium]|nr:hypothetical protein [Victivallaceae bacterium]
MNDYFKGKNVRIRCRKDYPEAHSHIMIGKVRAETRNCIVVEGRTFHFRHLVDGLRSQVSCGDTMVRGIPWNNIEIIHELSPKTDYKADFDFDKNGNLILLDSKKTVIALRREEGQ